MFDTLAYPNGIALDSERKRLFVSESPLNRILVFPVLEPGRVGPGKVFADLPEKSEGQPGNWPDGIYLDEQGNLFVAHFGPGKVQVLDVKGDLIRSYDTNIVGPTNVLLRRSKGINRLYITGAITYPHFESKGVLIGIGF